MGSNGLRNGSNLINLQQKSIARFLLNSSLNTFWVSYSQIVSNNLNIGLSCELSPSCPIILVKGIFNGYNWSIFDKSLVHFAECIGCNPIFWFGVLVFEVQVIFSILEKLRSSYIHANFDFSSVSGLFNGIFAKFNSFCIILEVWCETTFISYSSSVQPVFCLDQQFEVVVNFTSHLHCFGKGSGSCWKDHEFLHSQLVPSMGSTIDDVQSRNWHHDFLNSSQVSNVSVQWHAFVCCSSFAYSHRNSEDSISTKIILV